MSSVAQEGMTHLLAGCEGHLPFLDVEAGPRQQARVAGMVIVSVGDDRVADVLDPDADEDHRHVADFGDRGQVAHDVIGQLRIPRPTKPIRIMAAVPFP